MSKNYGPNTAPGMVRHRIWRVGGENPNPLAHPGAVPSMVFHEEEAIQLNAADSSGATERALGRTRDIHMTYEPNRIVEIRNPATDAVGPVGRLPANLTLAECFAVLYALGRQAQTDRDIAEAAEAAAAAAAQNGG